MQSFALIKNMKIEMDLNALLSDTEYEVNMITRYLKDYGNKKVINFS